MESSMEREDNENESNEIDCSNNSSISNSNVIVDKKPRSQPNTPISKSSPIKLKRNSILKPINNDIIDSTKDTENEVKIEPFTEKPVPNRKRSKTPVCQLKNEHRVELLSIYNNEAVGMLQRLKTALQTHRTKTFFRPDVGFIKGMTSAIQQVEGGINKMGQLFSSAPSVEVIQEKSSPSVAVTPPASEAGTDVGLNDSGTAADTSNNTSHSTAQLLPAVTTTITAVPEAVPATGAALTNGSCAAAAAAAADDGGGGDDDVVAAAALVTKEPDTVVVAKKSNRGRKRKRESVGDCLMGAKKPAESPIETKRPRRSLMSEFLKQKEPKEQQQEEDDDEEDEGKGSSDKEFEVEKILDYDRIKGKCLYQVRWRNYGVDDDTWEPLGNLTGCEEILLTFIRTRLVERSKITDPEELRHSLLPCEDGVKSLLRGAFFAQLPAPDQDAVVKALPVILANRVRVKEMHELEEDVDRLVAIKDCCTERYHRLFTELKQQLVLRESKQQRERQKAELRRWEREMSRISNAPAPLSVQNDVDLSLPPKDFVYINEYVAGKGITIPKDPMVGCDCTDCGNSQNKCCAKQMNSHFAYSKYGRLKVSLGTAIYECNSACACAKSGISCLNRVVQKGRILQLTIFRTGNSRGWGVKAGEAIRAGSFVTEYVGEVILSDEAERRGQIYDARGCTYLFDLDYDKGDLNPYTVDAAKYGNASHFINHSCDPNLVVFNVWVDCLDPDLPKLALFAARDIKKGEEITFDYNSPSARPQNPVLMPEEESSSSGSEDNLLNNTVSPARLRTESGSLESSVRKTPKRGIINGKTQCHCGAANCRKFFF